MEQHRLKFAKEKEKIAWVIMKLHWILRRGKWLIESLCLDFVLAILKDLEFKAI
jgi:hypothetical protein